MWWPVKEEKLCNTPLEREPWTSEQLFNVINKLLEKPHRALPDTVVKATLGAGAEAILNAMISAQLLSYRPYSGLLSFNMTYMSDLPSSNIIIDTFA